MLILYYLLINGAEVIQVLAQCVIYLVNKMFLFH